MLKRSFVLAVLTWLAMGPSAAQSVAARNAGSIAARIYGGGLRCDARGRAMLRSECGRRSRSPPCRGARSVSSDSPVVVERVSSPRLPWTDSWLPGIRPETLQSFLHVGARDALLDDSLATRLPLAWISRAEIEQLSARRAFWQEFYTRHPSATGYVELSSLGWSSDRQEALGYCGRISDSLSGTGFLVLVRSDRSRWRAVHWRQVWQS